MFSVSSCSGVSSLVHHSSSSSSMSGCEKQDKGLPKRGWEEVSWPMVCPWKGRSLAILSSSLLLEDASWSIESTDSISAVVSCSPPACLATNLKKSCTGRVFSAFLMSSFMAFSAWTCTISQSFWKCFAILFAFNSGASANRLANFRDIERLQCQMSSSERRNRSTSAAALAAA